MAGESMVARPLPFPFIKTIEVEPVGRWFLSHWERLESGRGLSEAGGGRGASDSESESEESEVEVDFEDDLEYLRSLDPKETQDQDHYKVLGLATLRHKATDNHIKKAYRFKVLNHHPDKRKAKGEEIKDDDDYFTCITKAFEVLGVPHKRRAYDSVDPTIDDDVPAEFGKNSKKDFFQTFGPVFEANGRWSTRNPVPRLGTDATSREVLDRFYKFWYDFESWREYSYLDEEDKEKGSDRDERRWIEKNNRVQRAERKKEEMKRIRKLVDNAYNSDPRIIRFREADKQEKLDRKKAKQDAAKARKDEEERVKREAEEVERKKREEAEAAEKARAEAAKKEKEGAKKALKKERKQLRTLCKDHEFYAKDEEEKLVHMTELEKLCELLQATELNDLNCQLEKKESGEGRVAFKAAVKEMNDKLEKDKMEVMEKAQKGGGGGGASGGGSANREWSSEDMALLIKAVNLFPAGTNQRWEVVAEFVNQHSNQTDITRQPKETLAKAKEMQNSDFHLSSLKTEANQKAYENLQKGQKRDVKAVDDSEASKRTETAAEAQGLNVNPWTADEQKLLEQALKTYPSSLGSERWEKISSCIPDRSKKDCMRRYKELAELIRAKKAAQAAAAAAAKR